MTVIETTTELSSGSFGRGWIVFGYGLIWLTALAAGFMLAAPLFSSDTSTGAILLAAATAAALAGGLGGATAMLQRLARHLSLEQNFHRQPLFSYLLLPLTGLMAGIISLFLVTLPGTLLVNYATTRSLALADTAATSTFVALYLLLAWVAGYYQEAALAKIKKTPSPATLVAAVSPEQGPDSTGLVLDSPLAFKVWVEQQRRVIRWTNTWGVAIFIYGLVWLLALLAILLGSGSLLPALTDNQPLLINLLLAGWPAILAGGIGGVIGMLYDLYRRISFAQDFDRQHIIAYLTLPVTGLVLGGAIYLFIASGYLSYQSLISEAPLMVEAPAVIAAYLVLGWVAGFRQQSLHGLIRRLIQAVIGFFRFCLSLFSPKLLLDQASRADAMSDIAKHSEIFGFAERDKPSRIKR